MPAAHEALFGPGGDIVDFVYKGKTIQGIWKRAYQAIIPEGVYCRSQDFDRDEQHASMEATASDGDVGLGIQALTDLSETSDFSLPPSKSFQVASKQTLSLGNANEPSVLPIMDVGPAESSESGASAVSPYWPMSARDITGAIHDTALEVSATCRKSQIPKYKAVQALSKKVSIAIKKCKKQDDSAERNALVEMANTLETLENIVDAEVRLNLR